MKRAAASDAALRRSAQGKDLQEDANILYGPTVKFDLEQCMDDAQKDVTVIWDELKNSSVEMISGAFNSSAKYSAQKWAAVKESITNGWETTSATSEPANTPE